MGRLMVGGALLEARKGYHHVLSGSAHTMCMYTKSNIQAKRLTLEVSFEIRDVVLVCSFE